MQSTSPYLGSAGRKLPEEEIDEHVNVDFHQKITRMPIVVIDVTLKRDHTVKLRINEETDHETGKLIKDPTLSSEVESQVMDFC